jgi:hypothetical protein
VIQELPSQLRGAICAQLGYQSGFGKTGLWGFGKNNQTRVGIG